jgi:hypothetical protein
MPPKKVIINTAGYKLMAIAKESEKKKSDEMEAKLLIKVLGLINANKGGNDDSFAVHMPFISDELKANLDENYAPNTVKNMVQNVRRLAKILGKNVFNASDYTDFESIKEILDGLESRKTITNSLYNLLKNSDMADEIIKPYYKYVRALGDLDYKKATPKELENKISYKEILNKRDEYEKKVDSHPGDFKLYHKYVILCLLTYMPPMRSSELTTCRLLDLSEYYQDNDIPDSNSDDFDKEMTELIGAELELPTGETFKLENFADLNTGYIVLHSYKTKSTYGDRVIKLPKELLPILKKYHNEYKSDWLIPKVNNRKDQATNVGLCHFLNGIFGKKISTSMIRKIFISSEVIDKNLPAEEKSKIARQMNHSAVQQAMTYSKFSNQLWPDQKKETKKLKKKEESKILPQQSLKPKLKLKK